MSRVNRLVAVSNAAGLPAVWGALARGRYLAAALVAVAMLASALMHLAQTKHRLPGVRPFARYADPLLWLDRAVALVAGACVLRGIASAEAPRVYLLVARGLVGLALLWRSERLPGPEYAAWHVAWHALAYQTMYDVFAC